MYESTLGMANGNHYIYDNGNASTNIFSANNYCRLHSAVSYFEVLVLFIVYLPWYNTH